MQAAYSRANPSPRYRMLMEQYQTLHSAGAPEQGIAANEMFPGQSLLEHVNPLLNLFAEKKFTSMLDYGCGKAMLYRPINNITLADGRQVSCLQELLGIDVSLYDPAYLPYSVPPQGTFDLVVCTDVLEHCSAEDVPWIVAELFAYADKFVYANIACYPAKKVLPNGENAHCTIADVAWWQQIVETVAAQHPTTEYRFICTLPDMSQVSIASA